MLESPNVTSQNKLVNKLALWINNGSLSKLILKSEQHSDKYPEKRLKMVKWIIYFRGSIEPNSGYAFLKFITVQYDRCLIVRTNLLL